MNVYAPNDDVAHYDACGVVNVRSAKTTSYHEFGAVAFMEVNGGHVVVEDNASVEMMYANPKAYTVNATTGAIEEGGTANAVSVTNEGDIDHAHTTIAAQGAVNEKAENVIFDYDGNKLQNNEDVYHHVENTGNKDSSNENIGVWTNSTETNIETEKDVVVSAAEEKEDLAKEENAQARYWIDIAADEFHGGKGTVAEPYQISSARELALLAEIVAGYNTEKLYENYCDKYYVLTRDIDLTDKVWISIGTGYDGNAANAFKGIFDGNNYTISNMSENDATYEELTAHKMGTWSTALGKTVAQEGLFGYCNSATIENVNLVNADFDDEKFEKSGFIACYTTGNMVIDNCHVDSTSSFVGKSNIGGLVGVYAGVTNEKLIVHNCTVSAQIDVKNSIGRGAGFVGAMYDSHTECYFYDSEFNGSVKGNVIGGFIGRDVAGLYGGFEAGAHFVRCNMYGTLTCTDTTEGLLVGYCGEYGILCPVTLDGDCKYLDENGNKVLFTSSTTGLAGVYTGLTTSLWYGVNGTIASVAYGSYEQGGINYSIDETTSVITYIVDGTSTLRISYLGNLNYTSIVGKNNGDKVVITSLGTGNSGTDCTITGSNNNFYTSDGKKVTKVLTSTADHSVTFTWNAENSRWIVDSSETTNLVTAD